MRYGLILLTVLPVVAAPASPPPTDPLDALVADSPFLPTAGAGRKAAAGATGPLELRSVVFDRGAYLFSLYDQGSRQSAWVRLNESGYPFVARSFNRERDTLTVDYQGRSVVLDLLPAKMAIANGPGVPSAPPALPNAAQSVAPQPAAAPATNGAAPAANNPAPNAPPAASAAITAPNAAEAQRLQNLADETRRRRGTGPQPVEPPKKQP